MSNLFAWTLPALGTTPRMPSYRVTCDGERDAIYSSGVGVLWMDLVTFFLLTLIPLMSRLSLRDAIQYVFQFSIALHYIHSKTYWLKEPIFFYHFYSGKRVYIQRYDLQLPWETKQHTKKEKEVQIRERKSTGRYASDQYFGYRVDQYIC